MDWAVVAPSSEWSDSDSVQHFVQRNILAVVRRPHWLTHKCYITAIWNTFVDINVNVD